MVRKSFMFIAGETSGDMLGAELVPLIRERITDFEARATEDPQPLRASLEPVFFGAGGPRMAAAGVDLAFDLTQHAVVGLWEVLRHYCQFRRLFVQLFRLAITRQPDAIVCIDFSGFNLRFGRALRKYVRSLQGTFGNWEPKIIQYISPQVWASRPGRAHWLASNFDLLLSVFPFEREWYAIRAPKLQVEFVGHPIADRYPARKLGKFETGASGSAPRLVLLPGSRTGELQRHLPALLGALDRIRSEKPAVAACLVLPNEALVRLAQTFRLPASLEVRTGGLADVLRQADVAIASTGTVTLECAFFGVPTVALYKTSWSTYQIGKQLLQVKFLAMPNLLAGQEVFPEFIQGRATAENISRAALELLNNPERRDGIRSQLARIIKSLGEPGASARAAQAIVSLVEGRPEPLRAWLG